MTLLKWRTKSDPQPDGDGSAAIYRYINNDLVAFDIEDNYPIKSICVQEIMCKSMPTLNESAMSEKLEFFDTWSI